MWRSKMMNVSVRKVGSCDTIRATSDLSPGRFEGQGQIQLIDKILNQISQHHNHSTTTTATTTTVKSNSGHFSNKPKPMLYSKRTSGVHGPRGGGPKGGRRLNFTPNGSNPSTSHHFNHQQPEPKSMDECEYIFVDGQLVSTRQGGNRKTSGFVGSGHHLSKASSLRRTNSELVLSAESYGDRTVVQPCRAEVKAGFLQAQIIFDPNRGGIVMPIVRGSPRHRSNTTTTTTTTSSSPVNVACSPSPSVSPSSRLLFESRPEVVHRETMPCSPTSSLIPPSSSPASSPSSYHDTTYNYLLPPRSPPPHSPLPVKDSVKRIKCLIANFITIEQDDFKEALNSVDLGKLGFQSFEGKNLVLYKNIGYINRNRNKFTQPTKQLLRLLVGVSGDEELNISQFYESYHPYTYSKRYAHSVLESMLESDEVMKHQHRNRCFRYPDCEYSSDTDDYVFVPGPLPRTSTATANVSNVSTSSVKSEPANVRIVSCSRDTIGEIVLRHCADLGAPWQPPLHSSSVRDHTGVCFLTEVYFTGFETSTPRSTIVQCDQSL